MDSSASMSRKGAKCLAKTRWALVCRNMIWASTSERKAETEAGSVICISIAVRAELTPNSRARASNRSR